MSTLPKGKRVSRAFKRYARSMRARIRAATDTNHKSAPNGAVVYEGPSEFDQNVEIVVIVTFTSANRKTGPMSQAWIMLKDTAPQLAGDTSGVCGDCVHRRDLGGACYVDLYRAPRSIWLAYKAGRYPSLSPSKAADILSGGALRFGAYGDPAAAPITVWSPFLLTVKSWNGYTHAWKRLDSGLWGWLMASADTPADALRATSAGWRTFRVRPIGGVLYDGEEECKSDSVGLSCLNCAGCNGTDYDPRRGKASAGYVVNVHGSLMGRAAISG